VQLALAGPHLRLIADHQPFATEQERAAVSERALEILRGALGSDSPDLADAQANLARIRRSIGAIEDSDRLDR